MADPDAALGVFGGQVPHLSELRARVHEHMPGPRVQPHESEQLIRHGDALEADTLECPRPGLSHENGARREVSGSESAGRRLRLYVVAHGLCHTTTSLVRLSSLHVVKERGLRSCYGRWGSMSKAHC